ncbi:MAG: hypothetical protein GYB53_15495 [Rhodobacteraceae bacterium]|uniref:hypothetical protein n=1 Tax=Pseudooceanicola sp. 200-1SW TaxID=3425949 RepID=UPI001D7E696C|nr:hypothetical protein [Paracoccaceae bacterium]MBR9820161.1 hypothetical protein [Paracoccaceae bacterium]
MFTPLLETLAEQGNGIHAYRAASQMSWQKAAEIPDHAAAFYLLATTIDAFVDRHERMPLMFAEVKQSFATLKQEIEALSAAYAAGDPAQILEALNKIAATRAAELD